MTVILALLLAAALVAKFAWTLAAVAPALVAGRLIGWWLARRDDRRIAERRRDAELCARVDRQHAAVLAGDELVGVYGAYLPAVR